MSARPARLGVTSWHRQLALGMYGLWLLAVVLVIAGRQTGFPTLPGTVTGVALGTVVFVAFGGYRVIRAAYGRLLS